MNAEHLHNDVLLYRSKRDAVPRAIVNAELHDPTLHGSTVSEQPEFEAFHPCGDPCHGAPVSQVAEPGLNHIASVGIGVMNHLEWRRLGRHVF